MLLFAEFAALLPPSPPCVVTEIKGEREETTHLCLIACRNRSAAPDELMVLSCDAAVAILAVRDPRQVFDDVLDVAFVGLAGAVVVACNVDNVGIALEDLIFK